MRIALIAIGRLGRAPEAALALDYVQRAAAAGRILGVTAADLIEVEARKPGMGGRLARAARMRKERIIWNREV